MSKPHKHAEVIKAKADGAVIQFKGSESDSIWHDMLENDWKFNNGLQFRIKPPAQKWPETTMTEYDLLGHCTNARAEDNALAIAKETGGAAFPAHENWRIDSGISLRDYFAAKAMQVAYQDDSWRSNGYVPQDGLSFMENNVRLAYQIADAMIAERAK